MTKIILRGCNGQMGQVISNLLRQDQDAKIVAGIDVIDRAENHNNYPVYKSFSECVEVADVIIDFSYPGGLEDMFMFAKDRKIGIVLCTTGFSDEQQKLIEESNKDIAIFQSANMSMGINLMQKLIKEAAKVLSNADFDIEIVEKHHNKKIDAPSGTALALADSMNEVLEPKYDYKYDRSVDRVPRSKNEIGIMAVRGGTIIGEHDVIFAGIDEVIEIKHTAYSRAVFAKGAIQAAKFLVGKSPGMYQMSNVID